MTDRSSASQPTPRKPVQPPFRFKYALHAFSVAVLVGVQLAACAAGFLFATGHLLGLPDLVLNIIVGLCLLVSLVLSAVLFVRTQRVEAAIERGEDAAFITWNPFAA
jgi:hypothetical protein